MTSNAFNYTRYSKTAPLIPPLPPPPLQETFTAYIRPHLSHLKPEVASQVMAQLFPSAKLLMSGQLSLTHEISLAIVTLTSPSSPTRALNSSTSDQLSPTSTSSIFQTTMSDTRSAGSSMRSSLSQRLSPVRDAHWDRLSLEASLFNAFNQEDNVEEETTAIDDSESSVDEDDVQGTIQKAIRDRFGAKDNEGKKAKSANAIQEDVASAIGRLLNKCMNGKELLQLAANVTAPSFARPLPTKDKKVRFSSLSLSEVGSRPHAITTLDECLVEALDRMMKENARLKEENEELQDVIDRIGSWSDSSDKKQLQEEKKQPSLIQRLLHDEENDPSASFGSRFYAPEEDEAAEVEEEQEVAKAETKPPSFDTFLHSAIDKQVSEALFS